MKKDKYKSCGTTASSGTGATEAAADADEARLGVLECLPKKPLIRKMRDVLHFVSFSPSPL